MTDPRSSLPALKLTLTYEDVRKLKDALKDAPQYDGLDSLRERLFIGNGLDPDPGMFPWVYEASKAAGVAEPREG